MSRRIILMILILAVNALSAQERVVKFRHLMDSDDLSSNSVLSICQDYRGFMWFGTREGLNRYDGYEFRIYYNTRDDSTSISDNQVNIIFEDSQNQLWIGTANGLNLYDRQKDQFVRFREGEEDHFLSHEYIKTIYEDSNGNIWVGTPGGLNKLIVKTGVVHRFISVPGENNTAALNLECILEDSNGNIWFGTRSGLYVSRNGKIEAYGLYPRGQSQPAEWIRSIIEDRRGNLWVSTETSGVMLINKESGKVIHYTHNPANDNSLIDNRVRNLYEDHNGYIWMGTRDGLSIYNPVTDIFRNYKPNKYDPTSLSDYSIRNITGDDAGGIWVATWAGGINYYHPQNSYFTHVKEELGTTNTLSEDKITYLLKDSDGLLWIGTEGQGLNLYNESSGKYTHFRKAEADRYFAFENIKAISKDKDGSLWIGSFEGLARFDRRKQSFTYYLHNPDDSTSLSFNQVHSTLIDGQGNLWIGTNGGGLNRYLPDKNAFQSYPLREDPSIPISRNINVLLEDSGGLLWIGTQAGLDCFDPVMERLISLPDLYGERRIMPSARILCLFEDSQGRFWIGTEGHGLVLFDRNDYSIQDFSTNDGLPGNVINAILEDTKSNLWISTNRGISRFSFKGIPGDPEAQISIRNFNQSEGLQGLQFFPNCAFRDDQGRMYFGGINGFNLFFPDLISDTPSTPQVVFTDFRIKSVSVKSFEEGSPLQNDICETRNITLNYSQKEFSITFAGLNYLNPENVYYSYRLHGMDDQWNYLGRQRTITFAYLTPGEYELMVRASDNPNIWDQDYASLTIKLLKPPWATWWAYLLYILAGTGIFIGILYYTYSWLHLKNELALEHLNREKEKELHQLKTRFFTDISHELRTPLTLILAPLEKLVSDLKENFRLRNQLMMIQRNGKRMLELINQVLDLRKFESGHMELRAARGNISRFIRESTLPFRELAKMKGIQFNFSTVKPVIEAWYDRKKLEIVMHNLLSNAFKATKTGNKIEVSITEINRDTEAFYKWREDKEIPDNTISFLQIKVEDNGTGIPAELLNRIFDRFYRVDCQETGGDLSTGVGLELTKRMVKLHRGVITVESDEAKNNTPGRTAFIILLPLGRSHLNPDEIIEDHLTSEDRSLYQKELLDSEKSYCQETPAKIFDDILDSVKDNPLMVIVEDNAEVCTFIKDLFKDKFKVYTAFNGKEGLEVILKTIPDVIISDVMMPEMDGLELCRCVKTDKRTSHIPVILLTARTALTFKYEGLETGADDYIHKPFSSEFLCIRVNNLIKQRRLMQEYFYRNSLFKPEELALTSTDERILQKAIQYIERNIDNPDLQVDSLSRDIGLSRVHLYRKIKFLTNLTAVEFIRSVRLKKAAQLIETGKLNVSEIRYLVGIQDAEYFRTSFKKQFGLTPSEYARQNAPL